MDVEQVISELYGLRPAQFTAARGAYTARARQEKDAEAARRIAALRKPTLALWAAGLFARARPAEARALLRLGGQLRTAHRELDGARLRALSHEQHRVIGALARESAHLAGEAGERISESVLREIEQVFHGLLADEDAGRQWLAGRLTTAPKAPVGFEGVQPAPGAVPPPPATPPATPHEPPAPPRPERDAAAERRAREHERRVEAARRAAADAAAAHERARAELTEAAVALERARSEAAAAREELHAAQRRADAAEQAAGDAHSRHQRAETAAGKAGRTAETATRRLRDAEHSAA
ncbi:hypothetical protein WDV06_27150 [Streptomyces racemochromogenes]|uniref:Uncharacterized protein n=1 Tax=Streptomyces racemochromogenes TaxID=67353 RepID=A0ABW7PK14_9ACTN